MRTKHQNIFSEKLIHNIKIKAIKVLFSHLKREKYAKILGVKVGDGTRIYIREWGSEPFLIEIGRNCTITNGVKLLTHDGATSLVKEKGIRYQKYGRIKIEDNVFIGVNSIILPGIKIHKNSIVAAGSIVTKDVEEGTIVAGNPARKISDFSDYFDKISKTQLKENQTEENLTYKEKVLNHLDYKSNS